jgi:DDE family transposase
VTSTRKLAAELTRQGHPVGADTVAALLKAEGFSLQGTSRTTEGVRHPDRDAQFRSSNGQVKEFTAARQQVISVDTKKQEVLGSYAVGGREWHRTGAAATGARPRLPRQERPEASALRQLRPGRLRRVGVGGLRWGYRRVRGRDLRRWWNGAGRHRDPAATRLLITADAGGERLPGAGLEAGVGRLRPRQRAPGDGVVTFRRAPPRGTRSSTGCSSGSAATGAAAR